MRILYCWDNLEHLATKQIDSMLQANSKLSFLVATKWIADDSDVRKRLQHNRIKVYTPLQTPYPKVNGVCYFLMYMWIFLTQKFDLIDVKMAQSREMKTVFLLSKIFKKEYILNMLGKERHIEDDGYFSSSEKKQIVKHIKNAKKIVCVDQTLIDLVLKYRNDQENIIKLWNSQNIIDLEKIDKKQIKTKYAIENKKVILYNHRLLKSKRPYLFFEFIEKILSKRDDVVVIIVSTVKELDVALSMESLCDKYKNILWLGKDKRLNFGELKELFSISHVGINIATLVVPSLATLEAMAAGIPQVISNEIDSEAYVIDNYNGYVLYNLNSDEILTKIETILDDEILQEAMKINCIKLVTRNFSQLMWGNRMVEIYSC